MHAFKTLARWLTPNDMFEARLRLEMLRAMTRQWRAAMLGMPITAGALAALNLVWVPAIDVVAWYVAALVSIAIALLASRAVLTEQATPQDVGALTLRISAG